MFRRLALCAAMVLVLVSCSDTTEPESSSSIEPNSKASEPSNGSLDGQDVDPVIASSHQVDGYPEAFVSGDLRLVDGCLLLGDHVVHWPLGTTWNQEKGAVAFAADFEGYPDAVVGDFFEGAGGIFAPRDNRDAVKACKAATGAKGAVYAYPTD